MANDEFIIKKKKFFKFKTNLYPSVLFRQQNFISISNPYRHFQCNLHNKNWNNILGDYDAK